MLRRKPTVISAALLVLSVGAAWIWYEKSFAPPVYRFAMISQPGLLKADYWGHRTATVTRKGSEIHVELFDREQSEVANDNLAETPFKGALTVSLKFHITESPAWFVYFDEQGNLFFGAPGHEPGYIVNHRTGKARDWIAVDTADLFRSACDRAASARVKQ